MDLPDVWWEYDETKVVSVGNNKRDYKREREKEDETKSDSGGSITFVSEMEVRWKANLKRQEARWIELGLDKTVPHARLQIVIRALTAKKRNKSIVEKSISDKWVRINEPATKKDNHPDAKLPIQTTTNQE
jgi:hypothetical protein